MSATERSVFASLPGTVRGQPLVLGGDPKGKTFLYPRGNSIIIRDIENPYIADVYTEHATPTTVAKYAPSGYYICSADTSGKVRIWDTTQKEHILKYEYNLFAGPIKDVAWSPDSNRIVGVGQGREQFAKAIAVDTGTNVGEMIGHSASINSCDYRPSRPFRIVTASEDKALGFYEGPPFRFKKTITDHTSFVNSVRYSPDGSIFISGGADGRSFIYKGDTGEIIGELGQPAHKGGVYALSFSGDGQHLLTVSGDKTAKMWDISTSQVVTEFRLGTAVEDMQVSCLWQGAHMLSVSLSGYINYLDKNNPSEPLRIVKGHNKPVTAMALSEDRSTIFTGSSDSHINYWDAMSGNDEEMKGKGHNNQIQDMTVMQDKLITVGMDDTVQFSSVPEKTYGSHVVKLDSQPFSIAARNGNTVIACINHVLVFEDERKTTTLNVTYEPRSVAIHPGGSEIAVGGLKDDKIHIYQFTGMALSETHDIQLMGTPMALSYSPDGNFLACAGGDRRVSCYEVPSFNMIMNDPTHTAKVNCLAWMPDSSHFATGSLDTNVIVWKPVKGISNKLVTIRAAHRQCQVTKVEWISNSILVSTGQDSCVKQWDISRS